MLRPSLILPTYPLRSLFLFAPSRITSTSERVSTVASRLLLRQNSSSLFSFSSSFRQRGFHVHVTVRQDARDCSDVWLAGWLPLSVSLRRFCLSVRVRVADSPLAAPPRLAGRAEGENALTRALFAVV